MSRGRSTNWRRPAGCPRSGVHPSGGVALRPAPRPAIEIAASLTSGDLTRLAETPVLVEAAGADRIHLDVEDGMFTPAFTVRPGAVAALRRATRLPLEVHLQTVEPERSAGS